VELRRSSAAVKPGFGLGGEAAGNVVKAVTDGEGANPKRLPLTGIAFASSSQVYSPT
jgi:hypothetical protein